MLNDFKLKAVIDLVVLDLFNKHVRCFLFCTGRLRRHHSLIFRRRNASDTDVGCQAMAIILFTARCYAERGIAMASCLSVRPSVCNVEI